MGMPENVFDFHQRRIANNLLDRWGNLGGDLGANLYLRLMKHLCIGRNAFGQPGTSTDDTMMAHHSLPTQNGGSRINDNSIFYGWLPFLVLQIFLHGQCPQGHSLVNFNIVAYNCGLANHDTGSMVDAEVSTDLGPRVNVDAGAGVGGRRYDPGDHRYLLFIELMSNPMEGKCVEARVRPYYLQRGPCCRVTLEHAVHIGLQKLVYGRHGLEELVGNCLGLQLEVLLHHFEHLDQPSLLLLKAPLHAVETIKVIARRAGEQDDHGLQGPVLNLSIGDHMLYFSMFLHNTFQKFDVHKKSFLWLQKNIIPDSQYQLLVKS